MFDNVGGKLKILAQVGCGRGIAFSIIGGVLIAMTLNGFLGLVLFFIVVAIGGFFSWLMSLGLYAFGQLVENSDKLVERNNSTKKGHSSSTDNSVKKVEPVANGSEISYSIIQSKKALIEEQTTPQKKENKNVEDKEQANAHEKEEKLEILNRWRACGVISEEEYNERVNKLNEE